jgi:hypothetical protein
MFILVLLRFYDFESPIMLVRGPAEIFRQDVFDNHRLFIFTKYQQLGFLFIGKYHVAADQIYRRQYCGRIQRG